MHFVTGRTKLLFQKKTNDVGSPFHTVSGQPRLIRAVIISYNEVRCPLHYSWIRSSPQPDNAIKVQLSYDRTTYSTGVYYEVQCRSCQMKTVSCRTKLAFHKIILNAIYFM